MKSNHIWIVEASSDLKPNSWHPIIGDFVGGKFPNDYRARGIHSNRNIARKAAKFMQENNSYNTPTLCVKYRVTKYAPQ
jgi:hypothetical protein